MVLLPLMIGWAISFGSPDPPRAADHPSQDPKRDRRTYALPAAKVQTVDVLLPADYRDEIPYPLLIVLHGNGGTAEGFLRTFRSFRKEHIIVAAPQGQYSRLIGGSIGFSWFAEAGGKELWELADPMCVENIRGVIDRISSAHKVRSVFVLGFSQGGAAAYLTGFRHPDRVAGVVAVGGGLPAIGEEGSIISESDLEKARAVQILVARGKDDPAVGREVFERQKEFLGAAGFSVSAIEYDGGHTIPEELLPQIAEWIRERQ